MLCGGRGDPSGPGGLCLGFGSVWGRMCDLRCHRWGGPISAHVHPLTALDPDLVVVADGGQLVLVQAQQSQAPVADHVLPQIRQWGARETLCPALHVVGPFTEFIPFGSQILKSVEISTVNTGLGVAAVDPLRPAAPLL